MAVPVCFPINSVGGSLFSTPSSAFVVCRLFDDGHCDQCGVIPHESFHLYVLLFSDAEHLFAYFLAILYPLWSNVYIDLQRIFFDWVVVGT